MVSKNEDGSSGVSTVVGALVIIVIFTLFLAYLQVAFFPPRNLVAEKKSHDDAVDDMKNVDAIMRESFDSDISQSTKIRTTTNYPLQLAEPYNPPETVVFTDVSNAFRLTGSTTNKTYDLTYIKYDPNYAVYSSPPDIVHQTNSVGIIHNETTSIVSSSSFVRNNTSFILTRPIVSESAVNKQSLQVTAQNRTNLKEITFTGAPGQSLEITIKTSFSERAWREILEEPLKNNTVKGISYTQSPGYNTVTITLDNTLDYTLYTGEVDLRTD